MKHRSWFRRIAAAAATCSIAITALTGCSTDGPSSDNPATGNDDAVKAALEAGGELTYWSWTPSAEAQAAAFEKAYPKVKIKVVNAGTNTTEYTKLQNVIQAGTGAPDVAQVEYYALPQFALTDSVVDLNQYGFGALKDSYTPGPWGAVNIKNGLYGLPQDSGPMAMFYNQAVFDKHGIEVPKTWDAYVAAAKKLHTADPDAYITTDTGDAGFATSMIWQAGGRPFKSNGEELSVNLADEGSTKWANTWNPLVQDRLLSTTPGFTDDWFKALGNGQIATLITGAWMAGILETSVKDGAGKWRVAPVPTYDGGAPTNAENGGGAQVVLKQSKNPALAAGFLRWLNNDPASIKVFLAKGGFPATTADLQSTEFLADAPEYFGRQKINEVLVQGAGSVSTGWQYLPYEVYANSIFADTVGQAYINGTDLNAGLAGWQQALIDYGNQQGFTVTAN